MFWIFPYFNKQTRNDCNWTRTQNHLFLKQTLNHLAKCLTENILFWHLRISPDQYENLQSIVGPELQCQRANLRERISPSERLTLTFRWLASEESSQPLSFAFRINGNVISNILADIFEKIWKMLSNTYVHAPSSEVDWLTISDGYFDNWNSNWNRVHCTGAIDGELIARECSKVSGCTITIIRGFLSLFFMTACDALMLFQTYQCWWFWKQQWQMYTCKVINEKKIWRTKVEGFQRETSTRL